MTKNQNENQVDYQVENQDEKNNIGCRLFLEQIELILQMPVNERKDFLWALIMNAYCKYKNQFENQIDIQNENQIECAYVSVSESVSVLSKFNLLIYNSMQKTVRFKKFSSNYGGSRQGSGRPPKEKPAKNITVKIPTRKEIEEYCNLIAKKIDIDNFIAYYDASNWEDRDGLPINWRQKVLKFAQSYKEETTTKKIINDGLF
ncbi:MAG: hypothetical protein II453_10145 [Alphaproteobacteria bacterium]|nr:hypothetical protein [Alphaproteobacteria bacterium]